MALIYIVEDDSNIREIESFALKNSGYTTVEMERGKDLYKKLQERIPNLIVLDVMLPDEDGLEIIKKIRKNPETKKLPVLMVTAKSTELDKVKGLDMGADDYLTKPFGIMEFISRVKALLRRSGQETEEETLTFEEISMDTLRHQVYVGEEICELTYKEFELLKLFMQNRGRVLTRDLIMEKIWGIDFEGETRTIDMHVKTLRQKLKNAGTYIQTIRNVGYVLEKS